MNKIIYGLALLALVTMLIIGALWPASSPMWLASAAPHIILLRGYLALLALLLIFTNPPRHPALRLLTGLTATCLLGWTAYATYNNHLQIIDSILFFGVGTIFGVTALERKLQPVVVGGKLYNV